MGSFATQETSSDLRDRIAAGVAVLQEGGIVAYPTDTVYGLGADMECLAAVRRIIELKGRSVDMGLPLLLSDTEDLERVAGELTEMVWLLAQRFWPGPLTLVVQRTKLVPDIVTGGRNTVAVRVPDHPVPRALASGLGGPITGTSANVSGRSPTATAEQVRQQLGATVDLVIDGGPQPVALESTILDVTGDVPRILRRGAVSEGVIQEYLAGIGEPLAVG